MRRPKGRVWAFATLAWVAVSLAAAVPAAADGKLVPTLRFKRVLHPPRGNVNDFAQDEQGFLWVAANEGLGRFDGRQFRYFVADRKPGSIGNDTVSSLVADGHGTLWLGTGDGLERLDLETLKFERVRLDGSKDAGELVHKLLLAKDGTMWIGSEGGLRSLEPATKAVHDYAFADGKAKPVLSLYEDKAGTLWVGTDSGLARLDRKAGRVFAVSPGDGAPAITTVYAITETADGLWAATAEGLYLVDAGKPALQRQWADELRTVTALCPGPDGSLIIGTREAGAFFADYKRHTLVNHHPNPNRDDAIQNGHVDQVFVDRGGVLWVGFYSGGVSKTDLGLQGITYFATKPGLAFYEEPSGIVWIGHEGTQEGSGLRRFDPKTGESQIFLEKEREGTWITQIEPDDEGWLWLGTSEQGLFRYNPKTQQLEHFTSSSDDDRHLVSADGIFTLRFDPKHRIMWIGTVGGGLDAYDFNAKQFRRFKADGNPHSLSSDFVFALHIDRKDPQVLWIGTGHGGLDRLEIGSGTFNVYMPAKPGEDPANKLSNDFVNAIHESADGTMWIGTYGGGLDRFDRSSNTFTTYGTATGMPTDVIYGIMEDKSGALWLTTNSGLVKFKPDTGTSFTFTEGDGIGQDEFAQSAYYQGPSGLLYVGGDRGFNIIDPSKLAPSTYAGPIRLTGLNVYGEARPIDRSGVRFSYRDKVITFTFASLSFADPDRIKYRYRLTPLYDQWIDATNPSATFTNLGGGKYVLEIQATNHHGVTSTETFALPLYVSPPPWRTWWAYLIYGFVFVLIVIAVIYVQRHRIVVLQNRNRLDAVERDLELTGAVQGGFLPEVNEVATHHVHILGYYRAADLCSGDWWWYEQLAGGRHLVMVGDVTGHGPGPAMVTAAVATAFRVVVEAGGSDIEQMLHLLNREVLRVGRARYHMTMAALEIDESRGLFRLFTAGAPPMISLDPAGKHHVFFAAGSPLGTADNFVIGRVDGRLVPGQRLMLYTDGIPETAMTNGQLIGMRRFARVYETTRAQPVAVAAQALVTYADKSRGDTPQSDDWTFALIEWAGDRA